MSDLQAAADRVEIEALRGEFTDAVIGAWLRKLHDATAAFRPAADAVWFTGRPWQPGPACSRRPGTRFGRQRALA